MVIVGPGSALPSGLPIPPVLAADPPTSTTATSTLLLVPQGDVVDHTGTTRTPLRLCIIKLEVGLILVRGWSLEGGVRPLAVGHPVLPGAPSLETPPLRTETDSPDKILV